MKDYFGIEPKNKEQEELFKLLENQKKKVLTITGLAGSGKSLVLGAYCLEMLTSGEYTNLVFSKPMEIVGNSRYWGTVPGDADEKLEPFLLSFKYLFDKLCKNGNSMFEEFKKKGMIKFVPTPLLRGVSFPPGTIVWLDEAQNISHHEMNTLGTRLEDGCRLILSGDINQVDVDSSKFRSGLSYLVNSEIYQKSKISGHVHLKEVERGEITKLFTEVFGAK